MSNCESLRKDAVIEELTLKCACLMEQLVQARVELKEMLVEHTDALTKLTMLSDALIELLRTAGLRRALN